MSGAIPTEKGRREGVMYLGTSQLTSHVSIHHFCTGEGVETNYIMYIHVRGDQHRAKIHVGFKNSREKAELLENLPDA